MKAKKSFGQNWLRDEYTLGSIVNAADITKGENILEVGPGLGALTKKLLETGENITTVEADHELIPGLIERFGPRKNFHLVQGDILKFDLQKMDSPYKVVANIPYYLTSNLIRMLLESHNPPKAMVLLVQKEVAQRIIAKPGKMSVLAFSVQYYGRPEYVMDVKKELFDPVPKVDSAVIKIVRYDRPIFESDTKKLFRLVKAGFGEKRKTLRNSLSGGLNADTHTIEKVLNQSNINPMARAQELSLDDWRNLYDKSIAEMII